MSIPARAVLEWACVMGPNLDYEQTVTHCLAVYLMHSVWDWKAATGSLLFLLLFSRIYSDPGIVAYKGMGNQEGGGSELQCTVQIQMY